MIIFYKCKHSRESNKLCFFASEVDNETHCSKILEWYPEDTRASNLKKCIATMYNRQKLSFKLQMLKNKRNKTKKIL